MESALRSVSLTVPDDGCIAMLGSNGAGKKAVLRALSRNLGRHAARLVDGRVLNDGEGLAGADRPASAVGRGAHLISTQGACRRGRRAFGTLRALEEVSFHVVPGSIHCVISPNSAGKSSLLNVLYGPYRPHRGSVHSDREAPTSLRDLPGYGGVTKRVHRVGVEVEDRNSSNRAPHWRVPSAAAEDLGAKGHADGRTR
jgi:ABC-type branched-subunit amino acid transport system ATPase component